MGTCNPPNYQTSARISPKYHQTPTGDDETSREVILFEVFDAALEFGYPSLVLLIQKPHSSSAKDLLELDEFLDERIQSSLMDFWIQGIRVAVRIAHSAHFSDPSSTEYFLRR